MAKTIQVRDVPEGTHRALRARAAAAGLSLSQYLLQELTRIAARPPVAEVLQRGATRPIPVSDGDIVKAVRTGRDRG